MSDQTVIDLDFKGSKTKTLTNLNEPCGISFLLMLDVVSVCDSLQQVVVLFRMNGDEVLLQLLICQITPVHVSSFEGFGNKFFPASNTNIFQMLRVILDNSGDNYRNSSAVFEQITGHRPHPMYSDQDEPAPSARLSSIYGLRSVRSPCFIADAGKLRLYTPTREVQNWMEILPTEFKHLSLRSALTESVQ